MNIFGAEILGIYIIAIAAACVVKAIEALQ